VKKNLIYYNIFSVIHMVVGYKKEQILKEYLNVQLKTGFKRIPHLNTVLKLDNEVSVFFNLFPQS